MKRDLLEKAVKVIEGIPEARFDLAFWTVGEDCGTVACAGSWLCMNPEFNALGLTLNASKAPIYNGFMAFGALEAFFDEYGSERIHHLFQCRLDRNYEDDDDEEEENSLSPSNHAELTDKELWLARARKLLEETA